MTLQYLSDNKGHTTAVQLQIPIEECEQLKTKYKELAEEEKLNLYPVPDWQMSLVREEKENLEKGRSDLADWEDAKKNFKFRS